MKWTLPCLLLLVAVFASPAPAAELPADYQPRLEFLEQRLEQNHDHSRYWQYGWTGFYAVSALAQTALWIDADDSDEDIYYSVGALKSAAGLADILLRPHPGRHGAAPMQQSDMSRAEQLQLGETLLRESAARSASRYTWKPHIKVLALNLIGGAVIAVAGDEDDALVSTALGIAIGEANIWSQPSRAEEDWREYRNKFSAKSGFEWQIVPFGTGLAVAGRF